MEVYELCLPSFLHVERSVFPAPFAEKDHRCSVYCLPSSVKGQLTLWARVCFWDVYSVPSVGRRGLGSTPRPAVSCSVPGGPAVGRRRASVRVSLRHHRVGCFPTANPTVGMWARLCVPGTRGPSSQDRLCRYNQILAFACAQTGPSLNVVLSLVSTPYT